MSIVTGAFGVVKGVASAVTGIFNWLVGRQKKAERDELKEGAVAIDRVKGHEKRDKVGKAMDDVPEPGSSDVDDSLRNGKF